MKQGATVDAYALIARRVLYPPFVALKRESHLRHLGELERTQFLAPEKLKLLQFERLRTVVEHAYNHCPFYAKRFSEWDIKPQGLREPLDIQKFPILTKKDIQSNWREMIATNVDRSELIENRTGGSTGKPLLFYVDPERMETRKAATIRHNRWAGYDIAEKAGLIWGATRDMPHVFGGKMLLRDLIFERALGLDASSLSDAGMEEFARKLKSYRPKVLVGYANSLYLFASFVEERNLSGITPCSAITTAEVLHPHQRQKIEKVFRCHVFDRYGSRETSVIASECNEHTGFHLNAECLLVEILNDGKPVAHGESGEVVITDLLNWGMPLIRYEVEDRASFAQEACPCGRSLPLLRKIEGRVTDFILTPSGRHVSGAALTIKLIAEVPGIAQAQLVQENVGSVKFRLVKGTAYSSSTEEILRNKALEFLGKEVRIFIEHVDEIPREPSGKYRFSVSLVEKRA
jgi:phenylacetate-CoA ligase